MNPYIGVGLYTVPEASRLTGVSSQRIRRWLNGYSYKSKKGQKLMPSLWKQEIEEIHAEAGLTFKDLLEIRFIDAFINEGVTMHVIRKAAELACDKYNQSYPFSSQKFKTDGKKIFIEIIEEQKDKKILDIINKQWAFNKVIEPSLKGIEFSMRGIAERWFPVNNSKDVVIDPKRSFGKPIIEKMGVPTAILFDSYNIEKDIKLVSKIYDVPPKSVRVAIEFEERLVA